MKKAVILLIILSISVQMFAQMKTVFIENNRAVNDTIFNKKMFFFDDFVDSRITMKDGSTYSAKINIVTIYQYVVMIEKGDTVTTSMERDIASIRGGGALVYKMDGIYHEIIGSNATVLLALTKMINFEGEKLTGAYGGSNETSSISKVSRENLNSRDGWAWADGNRVEMRYQYKEQLFLVVGNKRYVVTKKNFERLFPQQKANIQMFIDDNNIDMSNNDDVIALFRHLAQD